MISQKTTFPSKKLKKSGISPDNNWPCQALWPSMSDQEETEENVHLPLRRKRALKNQCQSLAPSKRGKFLYLSSEDTTIVEICQLEWTIKVQIWNLSGKLLWKTWITTIICPSSLMDVERKLTRIDLSQFWESMIFSKKEATKFFQSFLNWLSPSKVHSNFI